MHALASPPPGDGPAPLHERGVDVDDPLRVTRQGMEETWRAVEALASGDSFSLAEAMQATAGRARPTRPRRPIPRENLHGRRRITIGKARLTARLVEDEAARPRARLTVSAPACLLAEHLVPRVPPHAPTGSMDLGRATRQGRPSALGGLRGLRGLR